jgi:DNA-binding MarR family transcriptional regulator
MNKNFQPERISLSEYDTIELKRLLRILDNGSYSEGSSFCRNIADRRDNGLDRKTALVLLARKVFDLRHQRAKHLPASIFGEVAWDILLYLYVSHDLGAANVGTLVRETGGSMTTILRWLAYLEREQLVASSAHPHDARIRRVEITEKGHQVLDSYFEEMLISAKD